MCCQTIMTSVQSAPTNRNSGSGSNISSRCMHRIKVFFQATKHLHIFTSSEGFNINQKQTLLLDSVGPSWRPVSSDLRAKSFPSLYHLAEESTAAGKVQLSEAAISGPAKQTELMSTPTVNWITSTVLPAPLFLSSLPPQTSTGITISAEELFCR